MAGISAIILAAGESKRMGFPKMLLMINGKTMLENVIGNVSDSAVDNILVVLGADKDLLMNVVDKFDVKCCYNDNYKDGMLSSVKCGIMNLQAEPDAVMVFQGDQPFISREVINRVINEYHLHKNGLVIPVHNKKRGHPLLINKKYFDEIVKLTDLEGLHSLPRKFSQDIHEVETDDPGILRDFDTYEEYSKVINKIE